MKMIKALVLAVGLLFTVACTNSGTRVADAENDVVDVAIKDSKMHEASSSESDPDEVICRRTHQVGSNFPRNVCKTRRQMEAERRSAEDAMRMNQQRVQRGSLSGHRDGG